MLLLLSTGTGTAVTGLSTHTTGLSRCCLFSTGLSSNSSDRFLELSFFLRLPILWHCAHPLFHYEFRAHLHTIDVSVKKRTKMDMHIQEDNLTSIKQLVLTKYILILDDRTEWTKEQMLCQFTFKTGKHDFWQIWGLPLDLSSVWFWNYLTENIFNLMYIE